jgi:hypothetical protein
MGALGNPAHERFCQALHKRLLQGEKAVAARVETYREIIFTGDNPDSVSLKDNARKLWQRKEIRARLAELAEFSAILAGIDASWGLVQLKKRIEFNLNDFLTPLDGDGKRYFTLANASPETLQLLAGLEVEQWEKPLGDKGDMIRGVKAKIKSPDAIAALALMARIGGWEAPRKTKTELTGEDGGPIETRDIGALSDEELEQIAAGRAR